MSYLTGRALSSLGRRAAHAVATVATAARSAQAPAEVPMAGHGEREVLALVAEGKSSGAIAREPVVSEAAVGKHIGGILTELDLPPAEDTHRRVPAVPAYSRA